MENGKEWVLCYRWLCLLAPLGSLSAASLTHAITACKTAAKTLSLQV
jgi:hypothetical protein